MEQNEVTTMILEFFKTYGWQLCLIACSGIFILGFLKVIGVFDKLAKEKRQYVFGGISAGLSITGSAIYLVCTGGFEWVSFGVLACTILAMNKAIYAAYENYGVKALVKLVGNALLVHVQKISTERLETLNAKKNESANKTQPAPQVEEEDELQ